MTNIHGLDDLSLSLIFDRLSVEDLIRAGRVCSRWNFIRRKCALTRSSLKLLIGDTRLAVKAIEFSKLHFVLNADNVKRYIANIPFRDDPDAVNAGNYDDNIVYRTKEDDEDDERQLSIKEFHLIRIKTFTEFGAQFIFELFSNVRTLTTSLRVEAEDIDAMIVLLKNLSPLLTTLKLYTYKNVRTFDLMANKRLWTTVNSLTSLRVLHFDLKSRILYNYFDNYNMDDQMDWSIVSQLEQFHFNSHEDVLFLHNSFTQFGGANNSRLKEIGLACNVSLMDHEVEDDEFPRELDKCLTQINVHFHANDLLLFDGMASRFVNLTKLNIFLDPSEFEPTNEPLDKFALYRSVARLKQLASLQMSIRYLDGEGLEEQLGFDANQKERLEREIGTLVNVSVKSLNISLYTKLSDHRQMLLFQFHRLFPKLGLFMLEQLYNEPCEACAKKYSQFTKMCLKRMSAMLFTINAQLQTVACPPKVWTRTDFEQWQRQFGI